VGLKGSRWASFQQSKIIDSVWMLDWFLSTLDIMGDTDITNVLSLGGSEKNKK
jgi:hypothetical protein